jgi:hypothetical protein
MEQGGFSDNAYEFIQEAASNFREKKKPVSTEVSRVFMQRPKTNVGTASHVKT